MRDNYTAQMAAIDEAQRKIAEHDAKHAKMRQEKAATLAASGEQNDELQASLAAECADMRQTAQEIAAETRQINAVADAVAASIGSTQKGGLGRPSPPKLREMLAARKAERKEHLGALTAIWEAKVELYNPALEADIKATMKHTSDELMAQIAAIEEAQRKIAEYDAVAGIARPEKPGKEDSELTAPRTSAQTAADRDHIKQIGEVFKRAREKAGHEEKASKKEESLKEDSRDEQARKQEADKS
ncbi:uncharacterized protein AB675_2407 [Cyphellophora attinorum]|uniref:Uncharacterized protein n=1 Tax=Cyphellophora attinorum TaxID=1664694 RepID=A0A0N1HWX1_9EURO|nr:uncharacterized protein AB675_2407 [Phialophora attinorum]KPI44856.1 hypothetical protein AB675_2407 [Phialophora attinorum]